MGTASGVVAALVATVFALLVTSVRDQRRSNDHAATAEQAIAAELRLRALALQADLGERSYLLSGDTSGLTVARNASGQAQQIADQFFSTVAGEPATATDASVA